MTRQPAEVVVRDGGHRFGEMERDCMCSHGASRFTKGRMMDASDAFGTYVCKCCGSFAAFNDKNIFICVICVIIEQTLHMWNYHMLASFYSRS